MINFNYSGNLIIGPDDSDRFQNLYASQVYGSFFGMYIKLPINRKKPMTRTKVHLNDLRIDIHTFKGLLNIGFPETTEKSEKYEISTSYEKDKHGKDITTGPQTITIKLYIKARIESRTSDHLIIKREDLPVINHGDRLVISRELLSFYGESAAEVKRLVRAPDPVKGEKGFNPYSGGVFDEEFYYRNGKLLDKKLDGDPSLDIDDLYPKDQPGLDQDVISCRVNRSKLHVLNY